MENDQNSANLQLQDLPHKRLSTSSTTSNQSYDSNVDYAVPKHTYNRNTHRASDAGDTTENTQYGQLKVTNPLFGVNAASHYAPGAVSEAVNDTKHYDRNLPNGVRRAPEGQDNDAYKTEDSIDGRKEILASVGNQIAIAEGGTATYTTDNNGKINVHVTVMINAGNYMHPYANTQSTFGIEYSIFLKFLVLSKKTDLLGFYYVSGVWDNLSIPVSMHLMRNLPKNEDTNY